MPEPPNVSPSTPQHITVLYTNIQSINHPIKLEELNHYLDTHTPDIVALTETWLDDSTPHLSIPNYTVLSRRDRPNYIPRRHTTNHGGIIVYTRTNTITATPISKSPTAERLWFTVHTHTGPLLFGLFYRPPTDPLEALNTLETELTELTPHYTGTFLFGDFNIHESRWLHFSSLYTTPTGRRLQSIAQSFNLTETVRAPTRDNHLLDLFLTDHPHQTKTRVLPKIADHNTVLTTLTFQPIKEIPLQRTVWDFRNAQWDKLNESLNNTT